MPTGVYIYVLSNVRNGMFIASAGFFCHLPSGNLQFINASKLPIFDYLKQKYKQNDMYLNEKM